MILFIFFISISSNNNMFQEKLLNTNFSYEKKYQYTYYINNKMSHYKKYACHLAFLYQKDNNFKEANLKTSYCKKLNLKEIYDYLSIKNYFYLNKKYTLFKINYFLEKYKDSIFLNEIKFLKARYFIKNNKYSNAYKVYNELIKDKKISIKDKNRIKKYLKYVKWKNANSKLDSYIFLPNSFDFFSNEDYEYYEIIKNTKEKNLKKWIEKLQDNKYKLTLLFNQIKKNNKKLIKELIKNKKYFTKLKVYHELLIYEFEKKTFSEKEKYLNGMIKRYNDGKNDRFIKSLFIKKSILYKRNMNVRNITYKLINNYKNILKFKNSRKRMAYYLLKIGVYSFENNNYKEAITYLSKIIKKFGRWYKEYESSLWLLFKIYKNNYLSKKSKINKKRLLEIMKKLEKYNMKQESYFYKLKLNLAEGKEKLKIKNYFNYRKDNFYSKIINKKITKKNKWKEYSKYKFFKDKKLDFIKTDENIIIKRIIKNLKDNNINSRGLEKYFYIRNLESVEKIIKDIYFYHYVKTRKGRKNYDLINNLMEYFIKTNNVHQYFLLAHRYRSKFIKEKVLLRNPINYYDTVLKYSKKFNINPFLVISIMRAESNFNKNAYSSAGAIGLMQIMPQTGKLIARDLKIKNYSLFDPKINIQFGTYYLSNLLKNFKYQIPFAAAAYNGGPHNMKRWLNKQKDNKLILDEMIDEIEFKESRHYSKKIMRLFSKYNSIYDKDILIPINVEYENNISY